MSKGVNILDLREGQLYYCVSGEEGIEYARYASPPLLANEALYQVKGKSLEIYKRKLRS